jgi:hypothetical protein
MNNEFERMWKEAVVAYFKIISWHFPAVSDKKNCHDSWSPSQNLNQS